MNILSLTEERMEKFYSEMKNKKEVLLALKEKDIKNIWLEELN